jgi:hypothetical protein
LVAIIDLCPQELTSEHVKGLQELAVELVGGL